MAVSLTPQEASSKIQQIHDARDHAVNKLHQISDIQQQMLAAAWTGTSADKYQAVSQGQAEEFDDLIQTLNATVETATKHIHSISNADNG
jgi:uncharacterized protein YukE